MEKKCYLFLIVYFFLLIGCENTFEPLQENNEYAFSMYGVLDVHADTQWVRVMPIGESLIPKDQNHDGTIVNLIRESTGKSTLLNDSLFRFGNDTFVWNYWVQDSLHANEDYTIIASSLDEKQSTVSLRLPSSLSIPEIEYSTEFESISVSGQTNNSIIVAETRYLVQALTETGCAPEREVVLSHLEQLMHNSNGEYYFTSVNRELIAEQLGVLAFSFIVNHRELVVIAAGDDWPDYTNLSEFETTLPEVLSNVENGTGLIAGIARRKLEISERISPCSG